MAGVSDPAMTPADRPFLPLRLWRAARVLVASSAVGIVATLVDWGLLIALVHLGMHERFAILPACATGLVIQFFGNRRYAFGVRGTEARRSFGRQVWRFALVEVGTLLLNVVVYNVLREAGGIDYRISRALTGLGVYLGFSLPLWGWVFSTKR
jgi:putative flippase GtrA